MGKLNICKKLLEDSQVNELMLNLVVEGRREGVWNIIVKDTGRDKRIIIGSWVENLNISFEAKVVI